MTSFPEPVPEFLVPPIPPVRTPHLKDAAAIYLLCSFLLIVVGSELQRWHLPTGLLASELAFVLAPPLLYARRRHYDLRRTFRLAPISAKTAALTIVATGAAFVLVGMVMVLQQMVWPLSQAYQQLWQDVLGKFRQFPFAITVLLVSVLPGICEEVLFRGFLLRGMRTRATTWAAIVLVGILFGAIHLDPYRFLPVTLLGVLFGYLVVRTGSIFTGMVAHATNNSIPLLILYLTQQIEHDPASLAPPVEELPTLMTLLGLAPVIVIALTIFLLSVRALPHSPDETV